MKKIKRESFWGSEFLSFEEKKKEIGGSESEEKAEEAETWAKFQTRRGGSYKGEIESGATEILRKITCCVECLLCTSHCDKTLFG